MDQQIPDWFRVNNTPEPVAVWLYPSSTLFNLFKAPEEDLPDFVKEVFSVVKEQALKSGLFRWDNKVVIQCKLKWNPGEINSTGYIYLGYYDGQLSLGLGARNKDNTPPQILRYDLALG